jgi:hypothetical protein
VTVIVLRIGAFVLVVALVVSVRVAVVLADAFAGIAFGVSWAVLAWVFLLAVESVTFVALFAHADFDSVSLGHAVCIFGTLFAWVDLFGARFSVTLIALLAYAHFTAIRIFAQGIFVALVARIRFFAILSVALVSLAAFAFSIFALGIL